MKKMLVAAVAAMVAFAAGNANAQCIGCQQNAQPVFNATQAYSAPIQNYAPVQSYAAPMQTYSAPIQTAAPMQTYSAPIQSAAPMQTFSAPMQSYTPVQSYSSPCNCGAVASTPIYSTPIQNYMPTSGCIGCSGGVVGQPIFGGTVTSGTVINSGVVEGSIVEPTVVTPMAAGEATATPDAQPNMEDATETEPPVPAVSSPEPEADGT